MKSMFAARAALLFSVAPLLAAADTGGSMRSTPSISVPQLIRRPNIKRAWMPSKPTDMPTPRNRS